MIIKSPGIFLYALISYSVVSTVFAAEETETNGRSWYLGAGLGITEVDPDTNDTGYKNNCFQADNVGLLIPVTIQKKIKNGAHRHFGLF